MSHARAVNETPNARSFREAIARDYESIRRYVGGLVRKIVGPMRPDQFGEWVEEVVGEAVTRALAKADEFDGRGSAVPWVMCFAANIVKELRRERQRLPARQTDVGDEGWRELTEKLVAPASEGREAVVRRVQQAMRRLPERHRLALDLAYFDNLDRADLARALAAPSAGSARTRLCRALDTLRHLIGQWEHDDSLDYPAEETP